MIAHTNSLRNALNSSRGGKCGPKTLIGKEMLALGRDFEGSRIC